MAAIKKYFLYVLMFNSLCLNAMNKNINAIDIYVEKIRDTIDQHHFGIGKYTCCRPFLGSIVSYYKTTLLPQDIAAQEIEKIESYIPSEINNKIIFKQLVKRHWYVSYLVQALIKEEIKNIKKVKGSTIDKLRMPDFGLDPTRRKKMVHRQACKFFCHDNEPTQNEQIDALCIVAYENSKFDHAELIALLNSNSVKALNRFRQNNYSKGYKLPNLFIVQ